MDPNRLSLIDGLPPAVEGKTCREFEFRGEFAEGSAQTWLPIGGGDAFSTVSFHDHTIVWREGQGPDAIAPGCKQLTTSRTTDIGYEKRLLGRKFVGLACRNFDEVCEVEFRFGGVPPRPGADATDLDKAWYEYFHQDWHTNLVTRVVVRFNGEDISWEAA